MPSMEVKFKAHDQEKNQEVKFPSVTEMYSRLEQLRRESTSRAIVPGIGTDGEVSIDEEFKAMGKKVVNEISYADSGRPGGIKGDEIQNYVGSMDKRPWHEEGTLQLAKMDELLHFKFGDLAIALEGRPIYHVRDYNLNTPPRATVRHLGDTAEEVKNSSYTFAISEKDGQSFRVQVSPDGNIKVMDSEREDVYDELRKGEKTGAKTRRKMGTAIEKGRPNRVPQYETVEVPLSKLEGLFSGGKKSRAESRRLPDKLEDTYYEFDAPNPLVGGPNIERKLSPERPHKTLIGKNLIHLLQEAITSLENNAEKEGKIPSVR